ncbi:hypothetical protein SCLCIDRAFT_1219365 [Scleroderma citrinum Foug A]|uniref:Uncharacterized protein n=1 Tax=Scleroderma citrinum Foug A TaxID=1036808 RepID=A0A0C2ZYJ7_9AGAM|nr:hypothetical protein SCLCIDRAFT_1219365 [Scleroderma citrinum Foug A]
MCNRVLEDNTKRGKHGTESMTMVLEPVYTSLAPTYCTLRCVLPDTVTTDGMRVKSTGSQCTVGSPSRSNSSPKASIGNKRKP